MALLKHSKLAPDTAGSHPEKVAAGESTERADDGDVHLVGEPISAFDFYSCEEAIKRLNDYLDSELQPEEREDVMKHLKICAPCLERFHFEKTVIVALRERVRKTVAPLKLKERLALLMKNES